MTTAASGAATPPRKLSSEFKPAPANYSTARVNLADLASESARAGDGWLTEDQRKFAMRAAEYLDLMVCQRKWRRGGNDTP